MASWSDWAERARTSPDWWQQMHRERVVRLRQPEARPPGSRRPPPPKKNYRRREKGRHRFPLVERVDSHPLTIPELDELIDRAIKLRRRQRPVACRTLAIAVMLACTTLKVPELLAVPPDAVRTMWMPERVWRVLLFWLRWRQRLGLDFIKMAPLFCTTWVSVDYLVTGKTYRPRRLWPGNVGNDIRRLGDILGVPVTVRALRKFAAHEPPAVRMPRITPNLPRRWNSLAVRYRWKL